MPFKKFEAKLYKTFNPRSFHKRRFVLPSNIGVIFDFLSNIILKILFKMSFLYKNDFYKKCKKKSSSHGKG